MRILFQNMFFAQKCMKKFGIEFEYAQPANSSVSSWEPFSMNNSNFAKGFFTFKTILNFLPIIVSSNEVLYLIPQNGFINFNKFLQDIN